MQSGAVLFGPKDMGGIRVDFMEGIRGEIQTGSNTWSTYGANREY